mmetsp:Transcript_19555/g.31679  ORF Transcript_19555/g.31679 Transcript_19555/m.31679 type:complete len:208 (-) Transcript_19555:695-1318(-)
MVTAHSATTPPTTGQCTNMVRNQTVPCLQWLDFSIGGSSKVDMYTWIKHSLIMQCALIKYKIHSLLSKNSHKNFRKIVDTTPEQPPTLENSLSSARNPTTRIATESQSSTRAASMIRIHNGHYYRYRLPGPASNGCVSSCGPCAPTPARWISAVPYRRCTSCCTVRRWLGNRRDLEFGLRGTDRRRRAMCHPLRWAVRRQQYALASQ